MKIWFLPKLAIISVAVVLLGSVQVIQAQAAARAFDIYMDQPLVQGSYVAPDTDANTETFNSFSGTGESCASRGALAVGEVSGVCSVYDNIDLGASDTGSSQSMGGFGSVMATGGGDVDANFKINFSEGKKYIGFWWSAGSTGNSVNFYSRGAVIATINVNQVFNMFGTRPYEAAAPLDRCIGQPGETATAKYDKCFGNSLDVNETSSVVTSNARTKYLKNIYFGNPNGYSPPSGGPSNISPSTRVFSEPFVYIHAFALNGADFDAVEFAGKNFEMDNLTVASSEKSPRGELVFVQNVAGSYVASFDSQGGTAVASETFLSGGQLTAPTAPTKSGYSFSGWLETTTSNSILSFPYTPGVEADITLYAKWGVANCNPTIYSGTYIDDFGNSVTLPAQTYVAQFVGTSTCSWTVPDSVTAISYLVVGGGGGGGGDTAGGGAGGEVLSDSITVNAGKTFLMKIGAGGVGGAYGTHIGVSGETSTITTDGLNVAARGGGGGVPYNFFGGRFNDNLGGTNGTTFGTGGNGARIISGTNTPPTNGESGTANSITGISLTFGSGGGGGGGIEGGADPCKKGTGGAFSGGDGGDCYNSPWTNPVAGRLNTGGGGGGQGAIGEPGANGASGVIYVRYAINNSVQFHSNFGTDSITIQYGLNDANLRANSFVRSGYTFSGWTLNSDGTGASYSNEQNFSFESSIDLFAKWTQDAPPGGGGGGGGGSSQTQNTSTLEAKVPGITWTPSVMVEGDAIGDQQLNAVFSVPGNAVYSLSRGFKPDPGNLQLTVTFTPEDRATYMVLSTTRTIEVSPKPKPSPSPTPTISPSPSASATPATSPKPVITPKPSTVKVSELKQIGVIYFNNNEYFLDAKDRSSLVEISALVKSSKFETVIIQGNTDIKQGVDNYWLSKARAEAVSKYLASLTNGPFYNRVWYASKHPIAVGLDKKSLALNRRVEIYAQVTVEKSTVAVTGAPQVPVSRGFDSISFNRNEYFLDATDRKSLIETVQSMAKLGCTQVYLKGSHDKTKSSVNAYIGANRVNAVKKFMAGLLPSLKFSIEPEFVSADRVVQIRCTN